MSVARELPCDQVVVIQETEYTGAGKHPIPQLNFAKSNGIIVRRGNPEENKPGAEIVIPQHPSQIKAKEFPLSTLRKSYLKNAVQAAGSNKITQVEFDFLVDETAASPDFVRQTLIELGASL
jgi:hypothetical protein